jgi:hypothetical protein
MNLTRRLRDLLRRLTDPPTRPMPRSWKLVLDHLEDGPMQGRDLRDRLWAAREFHSGPGFYRMMARMEDAGLVEGWYVDLVLGGQVVRQRWYRRTKPTGEGC